MTYEIILADPPWWETGWGRNSRHADTHYPLMKTAEIVGVGEKVQTLAADDSLLFLWATNNHLPDALQVMEAWGFRYVTNVVWYKTNGLGLGQYVRMRHELMLIGKRGRPKAVRRTSVPICMSDRDMWPSVIEAKREGGHSVKPQAAIDFVETFHTDGGMLELFARATRLGWHTMGHAVGKPL